MKAAKKLWWKNGVIYQIYPRSFQDSNDDGIGDLPGIISRLDYIKDLGVDAIWLSPINPSPDADFGYDVSDYNNIDPKFGTMQDFEALLAETHKRGMRLIMDLVLNHTSNQHPWFIESRKGPISPYHDWYIWRYPQAKYGVPNNWQSIFGGSGWEYDDSCGKYYYHMFAKEQPELNWRNPEVKQAMLDVFRFWLDKGVDGFRLDVFNQYYKDAELRDNPYKPSISPREFDRQNHIYDCAQPEIYPLLQEIRSLVDQYPERYIVGESFMVDTATARTYVAPDKVHAAFDWGYTKSHWSAPAFGKAIQYWDTMYADADWPNYFFNNHDLPRSATRYGFGEDDERLKLLAAMHLTVRGTPFLYYGEEIGMRDLVLRHSDLQDPVGKYFWPFNKGRDGCRTPMQWDSSENAGFSSHKPWLRIPANYSHRNVANQEEQNNSLLHLYRSLLALRRENSALNSGDLTLFPLFNKNILAYRRKSPEQTALVVLNFSIFPQLYDLNKAGKANWTMIYGGNDAEKSQLKGDVLKLPRFGFAILTEQK